MDLKYVIILVFQMLVLNNKIEKVIANYSNWEIIETLAEHYPYVVAVLNQKKHYVCSGTIISERTVLTSGKCINPEPHYIAAGTAIISKSRNNNSIFEVAFTQLHEDYKYSIQDTNPTNSKVHSNIGLIFTACPFLDYYLERAKIGNYYAPELKEKTLLMVGYGDIEASEAVVLEHQMYYQIACRNPKWYYCICGIEYSTTTYEEPFGEGGPVLYNDVVVGIAATAAGSINYKKINYNIFTVISPYLPWIEKSQASVLEFKEHSSNGAWQTAIYGIYVIVTVNMIVIIT